MGFCNSHARGVDPYYLPLEMPCIRPYGRDGRSFEKANMAEKGNMLCEDRPVSPTRSKLEGICGAANGTPEGQSEIRLMSNWPRSHKVRFVDMILRLGVDAAQSYYYRNSFLTAVRIGDRIFTPSAPCIILCALLSAFLTMRPMTAQKKRPSYGRETKMIRESHLILIETQSRRGSQNNCRNCFGRGGLLCTARRIISGTPR
ncbi:hypothetical protein EJ04DRAFT_127166 [Polyplosphaeria fusca]|uniref:Uncharacterized protein n=1 Tax=Polyplosphaeria fusca TaxID=682080 RepID=A0A9P4UX63_9PLEO|nr:hypothetical protein EJ04DRAFT_127166 [Polyplosphaeria fusca]